MERAQRKFFPALETVEEFKFALTNLQNAANTSSSERDSEDDTNSSSLSTYTDGVHYIDFKTPTHASSEIFTVTATELGETIRVRTTHFSSFPDGKIDEITAMTDGEIKIQNGLLVRLDNPALILGAVGRLKELKEDIAEDQNHETRTEAEDYLIEAGKLMKELISLHQNDPVRMEGPNSAEGWAIVINNSLIVGANRQKSQFELTYEEENGNITFRSVQYFWSSEQPEIVEFALIVKNAEDFTVNNPTYLEKSLRALKNIASAFAEKRKALKSAREQLVGVLVSQVKSVNEVAPGQQILFKSEDQPQPKKQEPVEVLIAQTKLF